MGALFSKISDLLSTKPKVHSDLREANNPECYCVKTINYTFKTVNKMASDKAIPTHCCLNFSSSHLLLELA